MQFRDLEVYQAQELRQKAEEYAGLCHNGVAPTPDVYLSMTRGEPSLQ